MTANAGRPPACLVPGCDRPAAPQTHRMLCLAHWGRVPLARQQAFWQSWLSWHCLPGSQRAEDALLQAALAVLAAARTAEASA
jgi:hypothetical protein